MNQSTPLVAPMNDNKKKIWEYIIIFYRVLLTQNIYTYRKDVPRVVPIHKNDLTTNLVILRAWRV